MIAAILESVVIVAALTLVIWLTRTLTDRVDR